MRQLVGPHEHLEIFFWIDGWAGFEQCNTHPAFGQQLSGHAAARAGANHAHIVSFRRTSELRHRPAPLFVLRCFPQRVFLSFPTIRSVHSSTFNTKPAPTILLHYTPIV